MTPLSDKVSRWRALPETVKTKLRRDAVVDQVASSMAMEGEPVSKEWVEGAQQSRPPRDATVLLNDDLEWSRGKRAAHAVHASLALHGIKYRHAVRVLNAKSRDITGGSRDASRGRRATGDRRAHPGCAGNSRGSTRFRHP